MKNTDTESFVWETLVRCPICEGDDIAPFERFQADDVDLQYVICRRCTAVLQSPRMTEDATQQYYASQYQEKLLGTGGTLEKDLRVQAGRARHIRSLLRPKLADVKRMLDIGSAAGVLLRGIQAEAGCEIVGVEPGEFYRSRTQAQGLQVYESLDTLRRDAVERFDLISMMHVLEHLHHPVAVLQDLRTSLLKPDGYLILEVPNLYGHTNYELAHILAFNPSALRTTLGMAGFRVEWIMTHGEPRSSILPLYITLLARPALEESSERYVSRPSWVLLSRKLGMSRSRLFTRFLRGLAWRSFPHRLSEDGWGDLAEE